MLKWLRDFWRGYSDEDLQSAWKKICANNRPGHLVFLTRREVNAANSMSEAMLASAVKPRRDL